MRRRARNSWTFDADESETERMRRDERVGDAVAELLAAMRAECKALDELVRHRARAR